MQISADLYEHVSTYKAENSFFFLELNHCHNSRQVSILFFCLEFHLFSFPHGLLQPKCAQAWLVSITQNTNRKTQNASGTKIVDSCLHILHSYAEMCFQRLLLHQVPPGVQVPLVGNNCSRGFRLQVPFDKMSYLIVRSYREILYETHKIKL